MILFVSTILGYMLSRFLMAIVCQVLFIQANTGMHNSMTERILRATIEFFDSNPSGRVTTRFSRDMTVIDVPLPPITLIVT